ncbi:MAG: hypothetical protein RL407_1961 [Bacteroidota bacterium]|jgi:hypothetical protein
MVSTKSRYFLVGMILLSLALGIFISYFFVFVNALFISEIGTTKLPLAYLLSGIGGLIITYLFNFYERKWGFAKASTFFGLIFALVMFIIWYLYVQGSFLYVIIFFAYAWFWVATNFTSLVFWKLPSNIFNLEENKKYNGIISSGEGISAIISYLSVPALLTLDFFTRDKFLLISFLGILGFSAITFFLGRGIVAKKSASVLTESPSSKGNSKQLLREPYFQLIFLSVLLSVVIQFVIDFSLMEVSANQMSDPLVLAKYFSFIFGGMRVLELLLKSFVSKYLIKEYGVFISLSSLIFALGFVTLIGISSYFIGYLGLLLIVASLSKVFERSLYRSIYAPTINLLYQAYPMAKRALTQNFADGFGKTIGQLIAAVIILSLGVVDDFLIKVFILLLVVLLVLTVWLFVSRKLIVHYKLELGRILHSMELSTSGSTEKNNLTSKVDNELEESAPIFQESDSNFPYLDLIHELLILEKNILMNDPAKKSYPLTDDKSLSKLIYSTDMLLTAISTFRTSQLQKMIDQLYVLKKKQEHSSRLLDLIHLLAETQLVQGSKKFNFFNSQRKLKSVDFLSTTVIQHLVKRQLQDFDRQEYFYLLEERIHHYTYLLNCKRDLGKSNSILEKLIVAESKSAKNDILFCLSFKHDPVTLNQIVTRINQGDKTQELISLELLELILEEQEKKWILPIFKENQPEKILKKLESDFPQVLLGHEKRLLSIVSSTTVAIPKLIKKQALKTLKESHPSPQNLEVIKYLKVEINAGQEENLDTLYDQQLQGHEYLEEMNSLHHFYWMNPSLKSINPSAIDKTYQEIMRKLFLAVFPMEKLN